MSRNPAAAILVVAVLVGPCVWGWKAAEPRGPRRARQPKPRARARVHAGLALFTLRNVVLTVSVTVTCAALVLTAAAVLSAFSTSSIDSDRRDREQVAEGWEDRLDGVPFALVSLDVDSVMPSGEASVTARLRLGPDTAWALHDQRGDPILDADQQQLEAAFAASTVDVTVANATPSVLRFSLRDLVSDREDRHLVPSPGQRVTIPFTSSAPAAYPFDHYRLEPFVTVSLPPGVEIAACRFGQTFKIHELPVVLSASAGPTLQGWHLRPVTVEHRSPRPHASGEVFYRIHWPKVTIRRGWDQTAFPLVVACCPGLLALAMGTSRRRSRSRGRAPEDRTSPLELAGALLAVIALREVIVPQDLAGLTVMDHLLASELAAIVAIAVWRQLGGLPLDRSRE